MELPTAIHGGRNKRETCFWWCHFPVGWLFCTRKHLTHPKHIQTPNSSGRVSRLRISLVLETGSMTQHLIRTTAISAHSSFGWSLPFWEASHRRCHDQVSSSVMKRSFEQISADASCLNLGDNLTMPSGDERMISRHTDSVISLSAVEPPLRYFVEVRKSKKSDFSLCSCKASHISGQHGPALDHANLQDSCCFNYMLLWFKSILDSILFCWNSSFLIRSSAFNTYWIIIHLKSFLFLVDSCLANSRNFPWELISCWFPSLAVLVRPWTCVFAAWMGTTSASTFQKTSQGSNWWKRWFLMDGCHPKLVQRCSSSFKIKRFREAKCWKIWVSASCRPSPMYTREWICGGPKVDQILVKPLQKKSGSTVSEMMTLTELAWPHGLSWIFLA